MSQENMESDCEGDLLDSDDETMEQKGSRLVKTCASMILSSDYSFRHCEYDSMKNIMEWLSQDIVLPPPDIVELYFEDLYTEEKLKLKQQLATIPNRIALTFDLWESNTAETYICLTAHFVDEDWKLNSKVLNFCLVLPAVSEMCERMVEFLNDWGIEKKIFSLTLEDSFKNKILQEQFQNQLVLHNGLLCDGEFLHGHCFARVLKLIVEEGLKLVRDVVCKIRDSIMFVRHSENRREKFKECIAKVGGVDCSVRLHLDTTKRVNSTYSMLESALKYRRVFESLHLYDGSYVLCPSIEEWKRVEKICAFLLPFSETANMINATAHPTSNLYFLQVWKVQCVLADCLGDQDEDIKRMAERMLTKFEKYWDEYSVVLALGAVLDPRLKLSTLANCYSKLDASTCERKLQQVKSKLYMLFDKYSSKSTSSGVQRTIQDESSSMSLQKKLKSSSRGLFDVSLYIFVEFTI